MFPNLAAASCGIALMLGAPALAHDAAALQLAPPAAPYAKVSQLVALEAAVAALPAELRLVFLLHETEGMGLLAIARTLSLNPITVRTRLSRARKRLRAELEARLSGGFEAVFPFDGARCAHMADCVIANLQRAQTL